MTSANPYCAYFDKSASQYAEAGGAIDLEEDFTLEGWLCVEEGASDDEFTMVARWASGERSYAFYYDNAGTDELVCKISIDGSASLVARSPAVTIPLGEIHHIAVTRDASLDEVHFYLDAVQLTAGSPESFGSTAGMYISGTTLPRLGMQEESPYNYMAGWLDDVRIWNRVRTPAEMKLWYRFHLTANEAADAYLIAWYRLDNNWQDSAHSEHMTAGPGSAAPTFSEPPDTAPIMDWPPPSSALGAEDPPGGIGL